MVTPAEYLDHLRADIERLRATPPDALTAPVQACPGWTVADLLEHAAGVFRFATAQLRAAPGADLAPFDPPDDDVPPLELFSFSADELLAELVAVDPDEHRPNWAGAPTARFWFRRMAVETAIHRFDAQRAHGTADPVDGMLGADGIDELADVFLPHAKERGIGGHGESVHLHATDELPTGVNSEWMFTFTLDGVEVERTHGKADMAVRGPAGELLLFVWNRRPIAVERFGDQDPLDWWPAHVAM